MGGLLLVASSDNYGSFRLYTKIFTNYIPHEWTYDLLVYNDFWIPQMELLENSLRFEVELVCHSITYGGGRN